VIGKGRQPYCKPRAALARKNALNRLLATGSIDIARQESPEAATFIRRIPLGLPGQPFHREVQLIFKRLDFGIAGEKYRSNSTAVATANASA
jgi:hypothetical protein